MIKWKVIRTLKTSLPDADEDFINAQYRINLSPKLGGLSYLMA